MAKSGFDIIKAWQAKQENQRKHELHQQKMKHNEELHKIRKAKAKKPAKAASRPKK